MNDNARKKVLFLITKSNWGGAQRYVYDLATTLNKQQFEVVVALGGDGALTDMLKHAGVRTVTITSLSRDISIKNEFLFAHELWKLLSAEKPDILHVNSSKAGGVGTFLGRLHLIPRVIFTAHGWAFNEDRPWWQKIIIKTLHWITVLFSHRTIAVSSAIVTQLRWPLMHRKMKVIHPGRTIGAMYGKAEARTMLANFCPPLAQKQNEKWILTIAELHPIKRLSVLIDAVASCPDKVNFVFIGEGQERAKLEKQIRDLQLQDKVFLTGAITEAARFLKAADVFILPSKSESYGYVVHEAGLAGVPIIATRVGGITDIITNDSEGILIPADDSDALIRAIDTVFTDKVSASERAATLKEKLQKRSTQAMTEATAALYTLPLK